MDKKRILAFTHGCIRKYFRNMDFVRQNPMLAAEAAEDADKIKFMCG